MNGISNFTPHPVSHPLTTCPGAMASFNSSPVGVGSFAELYAGDLSDCSPVFGSEHNPLAELSGSFDGQTVSPADVSRNSSFLGASGSVPNSAALTNLTSPDMDASPYYGSVCDTSPIYGYNDTDLWPSLFPDAATDHTVMTAIPMERNPSASSGNDSPLVMGASGKSPQEKASPNSGHRRSTSGVSKQRRRAGPLKTATDYDAGDKKAMKRYRNTTAARESRQRKVEQLQTLEERVNELTEWQKKASEMLSTMGYQGDLLDELDE